MRNQWRAFGFFLAPFVGIGIGLIARTSAADEPAAQQRVMIRGTGNSISIERSVESAPRLLSRGVPRSPVLAQAEEMKEAGTTDAVLLGYLKAHAAELPGLIDFQTVSRLQEAGAGRTVIAYLTTVSAVEIGPTGAVGGPHEEPMEASVPAEAMMSNELPIWYGGYGGVVGDFVGNRIRHGHGLGHRGAFPSPHGTHVATPRVNAPMNAPMVRPQPRFSRR
jgi:hypothetical protein